jgi:hypothetical protein
MAQHVWTVACRFSMTDAESNNVSLIGVLEEITIPAAPPTAPPAAPDARLVPATIDVVTLWSRDEEERQEEGFGRMSLVAPSGHTVLDFSYPVNLRESRRFRSVGRILGLPAPEAGRYSFRVERRRSEEDAWEPVASIPLWVSILQPPAPS